MESYWEEERKNHEEFNKLEKDIEVEVCVIGGGLTGLTTAYYLSKNKKVAILEKNRICSGTSGRTTGKITSQHGLFYKYLIDSENKNFAQTYLDANQEAIENIENIVKKEKIDCDFKREDSYIFTQNATEIKKIQDEQEAMEQLENNKSKIVETIELPFKIAKAITFENQAKIHPVKYAYGLANSIIKNNGEIYENSRSRRYKEKRWQVLY